MYYINLFFVYSILGFIFENTLIQLFNQNFESGIMYGPWAPVYGLGVIIIILIYKALSRYVKKKYLRLILLFFLSAIILSILEFIGGVLIENIFNKVFWNYEPFKYNIGKYMSLETAAIWGMFSIFIISLIKKPTDWIIRKIPNWLTYILSVLFIIDCLLTLIVK